MRSSKKASPCSSYPKMMEFTTTNTNKAFTVLFSTAGIGTVVWSNHPEYKEGYHCAEWDMLTFKHATEAVLLEP